MPDRVRRVGSAGGRKKAARVRLRRDPKGYPAFTMAARTNLDPAARSIAGAIEGQLQTTRRSAGPSNVFFIKFS
ncbi:hypothetical protein GNX71_06310 [Variovorax sp. RKNM96]|uniref:hypothetical protein n=1 Tax=Variovorax sp. RKNM96 TaxID=2681552 RepID=UPI00197D4803|nr:hypothetical protein [Variovorax sp. RKNM96]QSI29210.1 hypothetical protein GNX71_06310 [Variovorax sp. RKNM96]